MTAKYAGPTVNEQLQTLARDAAYDGKALDLLAAAQEVGRTLSGKERVMAQDYYRKCLAEMVEDHEHLLKILDEKRLEMYFDARESASYEEGF